MYKTLSISLAALALATSAHAADQGRLDTFARTLGYKITIIDNLSQGCLPEQLCFTTEIALTLPQTLPDAPWDLYVSMVAKMTGLDSDSFSFTHIQGDLYRLSAKPGVTLTPGATYRVRQRGVSTFFSEYYPMPNAYVVAEGLKPVVVAASRATIDPDTGQEQLPFVTPFTDEAKLARSSVADQTQWLTPERAFALNASRQRKDAVEFGILPTAVAVKRLPGAAIDTRKGIALTLSGVAAEALPVDGLTQNPAGVPVSVTVNGEDAPESYRVVAENSRITITAADSAGAFYALQSLSQQIAWDGGRLKPLEITDAPRFGFRGLHLDVARNFRGKAYLLKVIGQMGRYKLNRLHLHLGDDEGWRLAIDGLPELTDIGGTRCHDLKEDTCLLPQLGAGPEQSPEVNGYLTAQDYVEIVKVADAHHIQVIPSFDMPGHSRAAVRSMEARYRALMAAGKPEDANQYRLIDPQDTTVYSSIQNYNDNTLNVCIPTTYAFVEKVVATVADYHQRAGVPLTRYHIGADETAGAWVKSPACQTMMAAEKLGPKDMTPYFIAKVSAMLTARGIEPAGWSDGMGHVDPAKMPKTVQSNSWGMLLGGGLSDAHRHANQGWEVVMSTPEVLYLDMPYAPDPKERGYDWASRGTDLFKVFAYLPDNLPANASLYKNLNAHGVTVADSVPLTEGHGITGMQGQLWTEAVRSDAIADYMLFPRALALAERAWHKADWEPAYVPGRSYSYGDGAVDRAALLTDWSRFEARLAAQLPALDQASVAWRLPVPGARIVNGWLEANLPMQGPVLQYRQGVGAWQTYRGPVRVRGAVSVRSASSDGKRLGRTAVVRSRHP